MGAWRVYDFEITHLARPGDHNAIAVRVYPPKHPYDLAISYVDWNPGSPDREAGLFREVSLTTSGPVALRYPAVMSHVELPDGKKARLTVTARLVNGTDKPQMGTLDGCIEQIRFSQKVELKPRETKDIVLDANSFPQLNIENPRLWWPAQMGTPNLYKLQLSFAMDGINSDSAETQFGIREITSELDPKDHRLFRINGKKILIRGGGWAMDMWKPKTEQRLEDEFRYVEGMGLNTIRLEGMLETNEFFDLADRKGNPGHGGMDVRAVGDMATVEAGAGGRRRTVVAISNFAATRPPQHPDVGEWERLSPSPQYREDVPGHRAGISVAESGGLICYRPGHAGHRKDRSQRDGTLRLCCAVFLAGRD